MVRMDIQTIVVGGGPVSSLVVLKPQHEHQDIPTKLPIRIGNIEASAISMGIDGQGGHRPLTADLLASSINALGASVDSIGIVAVHGTTFFANVCLLAADGRRVDLDARPSDAIALAVRTGAPIYADENVLKTAAMPDFDSVERDEHEQELQEFHDFVENLSPEDFGESHSANTRPSGDAGTQG